MDRPLVSVIVPNYCHARFLEQRIQSILDQTYQNFELIILDDCSQDDGASQAIIESYRSNPHVSHIVYNEVNSGSPFKQWRKGLELAKGEYVWIAESDDFCLPTFLETLLSACIKNDAVFAFCNSFFTNEQGDIERKHNPFSESCIIQGEEFIRQRLACRCTVTNASSVLFRKEVAMNIGRQYESMKGNGDWLFWIEMAEKGNVCYVDEALNLFRRHNACVTRHNYYSGNREREYRVIINYLIDRRELSSFDAFRIKLQAVARIVHTDYDDNSVKTELLNLWDIHYGYRVLLPFYKLYGILRQGLNRLLRQLIRN